MPLSGTLPGPSDAEVEAGRNAEVLFRMLTGHWVAQTVRAVAALRVVDHLAAGAGTADEVAKREGSDPGTTFRLMRAGAALGLLDVHDDGRFAVTAVGGLLREDVPGSLRNAVLFQTAPGLWRSWGTLPEAVRGGGTRVEAELGSDMLEYFAGRPDEADLFAKAMSDMTGLVVADTVHLLELGDGGPA